VNAKDGAVTLSGTGPTYLEKTRAVTTAEHVYGVKAIADDIEVHLDESHKKADSDIASSIFTQSFLHPGC
jgi:osmotically-inducible protein OsmY